MREPKSETALVPAVAGPFDVGTVVTREALEINPRTGQVSADGAHSDPIPHILAGIPLLVFSSADDAPVIREARYQAANCSRLAPQTARYGDLTQNSLSK
jgi:hypothetical protein